jgi:hypothetical protein
MRIHITLGAIVAAGLVGCTAFVAANLSSTNGTTVHYVGGCFKLQDTTCGQCIANNCENPNDPQRPVSLEKVCQLDQTAIVISDTQSCSQDPSVSSYECNALFVDGGTYAASIADESAAVNNLKKCITDNCVPSCSRCEVQVPTCGSDTIDLLEAGACGSCIDQAMNQPGGNCQAAMLQNDSCYTYQGGAIATCAVPSGSCQQPDCNVLATADAGLNACLWQQCGSQCPSP